MATPTWNVRIPENVRQAGQRKAHEEYSHLGTKINEWIVAYVEGRLVVIPREQKARGQGDRGPCS